MNQAAAAVTATGRHMLCLIIH